MAAPRNPVRRLTGVLRKAALANALPADLLDARIPIDRARALFSDYVDQVEIENHAFCNRVCWFCPNSFLDRRGRLDRMADAVFRGILDDLASIEYAGALTWSRYAEALADDAVHERVAEARRALPHAELVMISNGDYADQETLPLLERAGLDRLMLDLYLPEGHEDDPAAVDAALRRFARRTDTALVRGGARTWSVRGFGFKVTLDVPHYTPEGISTRGGLVDVPKRRGYRRRAICVAPVRHLAIDWNGKGMLCCQTRSDAPAHASAVIGDLSVPGYSLFHYYRDLGPARRALLAPGEKGGVCLTCDVRDDGPDRLARHAWVAGSLDRVAGAEAGARWLWRRTMRRRFTAARGKRGSGRARSRRGRS